MKKIIQPTYLADDFGTHHNCIYVYQSNFPTLKEITFNPTQYKEFTDTAYTVAVFKISLKSSIPVMQVNKEGQLIAY
jgi:hypothetical protein